MKLQNYSSLDPRFPTRYSGSGGGDNPDSKYAGAMTLCGQKTAMDSDSAPKATYPTKHGEVQIQIQDSQHIQDLEKEMTWIQNVRN